MTGTFSSATLIAGQYSLADRLISVDRFGRSIFGWSLEDKTVSRNQRAACKRGMRCMCVTAFGKLRANQQKEILFRDYVAWQEKLVG